LNLQPISINKIILRFKTLIIITCLLSGFLGFSQCVLDIDSVKDATCGENNGAVFLHVEGGIDTSQIAWFKNGAIYGLGGLSRRNLEPAGYTVQGSGDCGEGEIQGTKTDTVERVQASLPVIQFESATGETCPGDEDGIAIISTTGGFGDISYIWSNGSTNQNAINLSPGYYDVIVQDELGCRDSFLQIAIQAAVPIVIDSLEDIEIFLGGEKQVNPIVTGGNGSLSYAWTPTEGISCDAQCVNPRIKFTSTATATLTVKDERNCSTSFSILVEVIEEIPEIFVPSAFSPNGDNINDVLQVYGQGIEYMTLSIFDRWGKLVNQIKNQNESWDGNYSNGKPAPTGTYVYILEIEYLSEMGIPHPKPMTGNVTLLRE